MHFSVIYSVDVPRTMSIDRVRPPKCDAWHLTEKGPTECPHIPGGKHRKWSALLTRPEFEDFLRTCYLFAETGGTLGAVGAPGFGPAWVPAICFRGSNQAEEQTAYVVPVPRKLLERKAVITTHDWTRMRRAIIKKYGA